MSVGLWGQHGFLLIYFVSEYYVFVGFFFSLSSTSQTSAMIVKQLPVPQLPFFLVFWKDGILDLTAVQLEFTRFEWIIVISSDQLSRFPYKLAYSVSTHSPGEKGITHKIQHIWRCSTTPIHIRLLPDLCGDRFTLNKELPKGE